MSAISTSKNTVRVSSGGNHFSGGGGGGGGISTLAYGNNVHSVIVTCINCTPC